jgi:Tol biopolymer transport system component/dienelactone hydrolase
MLVEPQVADDAPWKKRFRAERVFARLAQRAPHRGLVSSNRTGKYELYAWEVSSGALTQLTERPAGTFFGGISPDGSWVYYLDDHEGDECGHFVRVPFEGGAAQDLTPNLPPYSSYAGAVSDSGSLFGLTAPGPDGFDCYVLTQDPGGETGEPRLIHRSSTLASGPALSYDGELAVWTAARQGQLSFGLLAFDPETGEKVAELWDGEDGSIDDPMFSPQRGDLRLAAASDRSGAKRPLVWNPRTDERTDLAVSHLEGEVLPWNWSADARHLLLNQIVGATQQLWLYEIESGELRRLEHPSGFFAGPCFLPGGDIAVQWEDSIHSRRVIVLDGQTGRQKDELLAPSTVPDGRSWRSITFPSSDGQEIQGWLATPEGEGPFPTILETHGGPTAAQLNVFLPGSQAWLDHGFAYCTINYRGSTTFGRNFERKIWGDLGYWEVEDMVAGRRWLVDQGVACPDAIFVTGWSYGGYLTLQSLGTYPDLWAGGMGGVVVADWVSQYEDESEMLRGYDVGLFGGPLEEKRNQYEKSSPIRYVENLKAPLLIIQGRNDTRDPPRQVELYEARAMELGKAVEVHWFDTGHAGSFLDSELAIAHQELMLRFVYRVLAESRVVG